MKKTVCILLVVIMAVTAVLCSCNDTGNASDSDVSVSANAYVPHLGETTKYAGKTLTILASGGDTADDYRAFAKEAKGNVSWFSLRDTPESGYFLKDGTIYEKTESSVQAFLPASGIFLPGIHNVDNYMAAFAAVQGYVSAENCRLVAGSFRGVAHRLEIIRELRGVRGL